MRGELVQQPLQRGSEEWEVRALAERELGERRRLRLAQRRPRVRRRVEHRGSRAHPRRPERLELDCRQLAEPGERRPAGERADDDQLGCGPDAARERERVDQLQLVVEVVLEPEDDFSASS